VSSNQQTTSETLINKYRPTDWEDVLGQEEIVDSVKTTLDAGTARAFIFSGEAGIGKTTIARLIGSWLDVYNTPGEYLEIDAATYTGVEDMRSLTSRLKYRVIGSNPNRLIIIDEAHMLSKSAWSSLLKVVEDIPKHTYWVFCTTEPAKIPTTIKSRCSSFKLRPVENDIIFGLLLFICEEEKYDLPKEVLKVVVKRSDGSPRTAITNLSQIIGCKTKADAAIVLNTAEGTQEIIDLCRILASGRDCNWVRLKPVLEKLSNTNPETIRIVVTSYFTKVFLNTTSKNKKIWCQAVLRAFSQPFNQSDKMAPVILAIGDLI
jgi:DNA polymerase-3 subunit gamma/tau